MTYTGAPRGTDGGRMKRKPLTVAMKRVKGWIAHRLARLVVLHHWPCNDWLASLMWDWSRGPSFHDLGQQCYRDVCFECGRGTDGGRDTT